MAKTLNKIIASALIAGNLLCPVYSAEKKQSNDYSKGLGQAVSEGVGESLEKGLEKELSGLNAFKEIEDGMEKGTKGLRIFGSIFDSIAKTRKQIQGKKYAYDSIKKYYNQNKTEGGKILINIIDSPENYLKSMNPEKIKNFEDYYLFKNENKDELKKVCKKFLYNPSLNSLELKEKLIIFTLLDLEKSQDKTYKEFIANLYLNASHLK